MKKDERGMRSQISLIVTLALALAGCILPGGHTPSALAPAATVVEAATLLVDAPVPVPSSTPEPVPTPSAEVSAPPADIPWDLPVYPRATVDVAEEQGMASGNLLSGFGDTGVRAAVGHAYRAAADLGAVSRFYDEELYRAGWQQFMLLAIPGFWSGMWHRGDLVLEAMVEGDGGEVSITLVLGLSEGLPPALEICTAREAYARALDEVATWREDAYLVELHGGVSRMSPISRGGCSQKWTFVFYSPGAQQKRAVGIGFGTATPAEGRMGEPEDSPERPPLAPWIDSPQVYAAAEGLGGSEVREKYLDACMGYYMTIDRDTGRSVCVVTYTSFDAPVPTNGNIVFRILLDAMTGELIKVQIKDGVWQG